ncbi:MAG: hypothetical protein FWE13_05880 [Firmicutes bacterium]|nr:hypothetical protein [Bacillota bacterium]
MNRVAGYDLTLESFGIALLMGLIGVTEMAFGDSIALVLKNAISNSKTLENILLLWMIAEIMKDKV